MMHAIIGTLPCASLLPGAVCHTRHGQPPPSGNFPLCVEFELSPSPGDTCLLWTHLSSGYIEPPPYSPTPPSKSSLQPYHPLFSGALMCLPLSAHVFECSTVVFVSISPGRLRRDFSIAFLDEAGEFSAELLRRNAVVYRQLSPGE